MKKLILIAILLMLGITVSNAQGIRFGAKAGANFSNASGDDADGTDSRTGLNIGAVAEIEVSELFAVLPEVTYSMRGFKDGEFTIKVDYIDVPVLADFEVAEGLSLQGGPVFGFNVSGKVEDGAGNETDLEDISTLNIGAGIGAQYEFPFGLFLQVRFDTGFNDIFDVEPSFDAKNSNLSASAGFFFN